MYTTQEFNELTLKNFPARLAQENLASKTDIPDTIYFVKKTDFDNKLISFNKRITSRKARDINFKLI